MHAFARLLPLVTLLFSIAAGCGLPFPGRALAAEQLTVRQTIAAALDPATRALRVTALLELGGPRLPEVQITLSAKAARLSISDGEKPLRFTRTGDLLRVPLPRGTHTLLMAYALPLEPAPASLPPSQDNPGALAGESLSGPDWAMLMPGSLWHPEVRGRANAYRLRVTAPAGLKAVTQGRLEGFTERPDATDSAWDIPRPVGRLGLCLARYAFEQSEAGPASVQTFLLENNRRLASVYLEASARHLAFYQDLHGPYPFEKFAVVENPLPTGYGFPSYTLLGSQVVALPFIPETSLRHEIAHCWWGNGVLVDYAQGNWCEGLTTYVADYLAQEQASPAEARAYRLKTLRAFAALAGSGGDMPLERFGARFSPASQAVGYGKAMFVFHMLRGIVGDEPFWAALRQLYAKRLFIPTTWEDIRQAFAGLPGFDEARSRRFFSQWLTRTGGPRLTLSEVESIQEADGSHSLTATVSQQGEPYLLRLSLVADTARGEIRQDLILDTSSQRVSLTLPAAPTRLTLDPGADCFRLLEAGEIPPTVNSLKARRPTVVVADGASPALRQALPRLLAGLGHPDAPTLPEKDLTPELASLADLLLVGLPAAPVAGLDEALARAAGSLAPGGQMDTGVQTGQAKTDVSGGPLGWPGPSQGADTLFAVLPRSGASALALLLAAPEASPEDAARAASLVTHYGSFSLLGFSKGRNVMKLTLDPPASPLVWTPTP